MHLFRVFVYFTSDVSVIVAILQQASPPNLVPGDSETVLEAARRLGRTKPETQVELAKHWSFEQVIVALTLAGFTFKKFVSDGSQVAANQRTGDLLKRFRDINDGDALRYFLQQLLNGGAHVRLEPIPGYEARMGGAEPIGQDGNALFV
jgi:hypothetical protein